MVLVFLFCSVLVFVGISVCLFGGFYATVLYITQTLYTAEVDLEYIFISILTLLWDYIHTLPYPVYAGMGTEPRAGSSYRATSSVE